MYLDFTYDYGDNRFLDYYDEENTEKQVREHYPKLTELDWDFICLVGNLSLCFVEEFKPHINWRSLSKNKRLDMRIICKFADLLDWEDIWFHHELDENFVGAFLHEIYSQAFVKNRHNNYKLIHQFAQYLDWSDICKDQYILTNEFIREFGEYIDWDVALKNGNIYDDDILREFLPNMDLYLLVAEQLCWQGKEDMLRELKNLINWDTYKHNYNLNDELIEVYDWWWSRKRTKRERIGK